MKQHRLTAMSNHGALVVLLLVVLPARASDSLLLGMQDAQRTKQLRILAFGDSLTEGWIQSTGEKHPYTWNLQRRLQERLAKRGIGVQVTTEGVGGAGVLDRLGDAWYAQLNAARAAGRPYHYAVMMAGVNDLLRQGRGADETFDQLSKMWAAANKDGTTVVVVPVLPTKYDSIEPRRQALNAKTRRAAADVLRQAGGGGGGGRAAPGVLLLDLEKSFDLKDGRVYDDGLHFTDYGYQQHLSGLVYDGLVWLLRL